MDLLTAALIAWVIMHAAGQVRQEWAHQRDTHAGEIARRHPAWSSRKVRRHARWRAANWWGHEAAEGFPAFRRAWAEDREHVRFLRETGRLDSEARLHTWRTELARLRDQRAQHAAAVRRGETTASFIDWLNAAPAVTAAEPAASPPGQDAAPTPAVTAAAPKANPSGPDSGSASQPGPATRNPAGESAGSAPAPNSGSGPATGLSPEAPPGQARSCVACGGPLTGGRLLVHEDCTRAANGRAATAGHLSDHGSGTQQSDPRRGNVPAPRDPVGGTSADRPSNEGGTTVTTPAPAMPNGELAGDSPYRAAITAMDGFDQVAQSHAQAAETLEAQLTMHGFDRDNQLMDHVRAIRELVGQLHGHTAGARQVLVDHHSGGDEYHTSGLDAEASAFRN